MSAAAPACTLGVAGVIASDTEAEMTGRPRARRRSRPPSALLQLLETRAWFEGSATLAMLPLWRLAPRGDGHHVLVIPGLCASDDSTKILRTFLGTLGYAVSPWNQGRNFGVRPGVLEGIRSTLTRLAAHGRKVSLIGWSLGGLYARELAKEVPDAVRLVITLGSPFAGESNATPASRLYEWVSGCK